MKIQKFHRQKFLEKKKTLPSTPLLHNNNHESVITIALLTEGLMWVKVVRGWQKGLQKMCCSRSRNP